MAAESADENELTPKASGGGGLIKWGLLAVVSAGASFAVSFFLSPDSAAESAVCVVPEAGEPLVSPLARDDQAYVELKEVLITIGNAPATRYVKMNISVVTDKKNTDQVLKAEPMLVDAFVSYMRSVELSDFESAGFYPRMREQLAHRSELVLGGDVSRGVLVTEFLLR